MELARPIEVMIAHAFISAGICQRALRVVLNTPKDSIRVFR